MKREYILKTIWEDDDYFVGRSVDVFSSKLRKYLSSDSKTEIANVHGSGYKFDSSM
ncbi:MAG: DNA-binding response OmpR family regulator [Salibacteraceae bacterium]|jgi:DNA-binding response OmpR family regulator